MWSIRPRPRKAVEIQLKKGEQIMKKLLCILLAACMAMAMLTVAVADDAKTIKVGTIQALSGSSSIMGNMIEGGVDWAVELLNRDGASAIAVFGDSLSQQGFWTQPFERRIRARFPGRFSVINRGINGNRVLRDTSPVFPLHGFYGVRGVNRLQRDVLQYPDVSHAILSLGVNDLIHYASISGKPQEKPDVDVLCEAIFSLSDRMRANGIRVMGCTLVYFRDCIDATDEKADLCDQVNAVLRQNESRFDALFDLNAVVADPARPQHTRLDYLGKDKMHFNILGGAAVADAIDLGFFRL